MVSVLAILIVLVAIILSGVFSGAETGMYQLSRIRLRLAVGEKQGLTRLLARTLRDSPGLLVATLIGNTITVYVATSTVTFYLMQDADTAHGAEWLATLITSPILFVCAEMLPKNLFLFRADRLMPMISPILFGTYQTLHACGIIRLLQFVASFFARVTGTAGPSRNAAESLHRHEIVAILKDTQDEGFLSGVQTGMMNRLVSASTMPVKVVMTRFSKAEKVEVHCNRDRLRRLLQRHVFTRVLVFRGTPDRVLGFVNVYQALVSQEPFSSLKPFVQPVETIDADTPVTSAIARMQRDKLKILLVTQAQRHNPEQPIGIVTMKDLAEELLGELRVW